LELNIKPLGSRFESWSRSQIRNYKGRLHFAQPTFEFIRSFNYIYSEEDDPEDVELLEVLGLAGADVSLDEELDSLLDSPAFVDLLDAPEGERLSVA
jgi:hypothetical protein